MRLPLSLLCLFSLFGCVATQEKHAQIDDRPGPIHSDIELVRHFLDALYRPSDTAYRVIADAESEEMMGHIPLAERNRSLRNCLDQLRHAPTRIIMVTLHSGDRPEPWGSNLSLYSYDARTGGFTSKEPHKIGGEASDMWIDVRHWPNGTRLVSLSHTWIDDFKSNTFHLRKWEQTFRFAIAIEPLID